MKVESSDGTPVEELFIELDKESKKKNFRNWLDKRFPSGIAGYGATYALTRPWKILRHIEHQIEYAWQRVFRGWDDRVIWSIDYHMAVVVPEWIRTLKVRQHGIPMSMFEGLEEERFENGVIGYGDENMKIASDKWNNILDEIANGFEAYNKIDDLPYNEREKAFEKFNEVFDLFKKYYADLWD
jgi:hypothetical protein